MTHIFISRLAIIGSNNGLSPGRHQATIWTNAGILSIGPSGTIFSEISIENHTFSFKKLHLKISSAKWWPFCLRPNMLTHWPLTIWQSFKKCSFWTHLTDWYHEYLLWNCPKGNVIRRNWRWVKIGSYNGLVPSGSIRSNWQVSNGSGNGLLPNHGVLNLSVRGQSFLGLTRSISWLLMPWRRKEPGHQQPWYWLCIICGSWSYMRKGFKYLCQINVEWWLKM